MRNDVIVEIVEFYPEKRKSPAFMGTMHAYIEIGPVKFDMRGIRVVRRGKKQYIFPPHFTGNEQGEKVRYPLLSLINQDLNKQMKSKIIGEGRKFLKDNGFVK